MPSKKPADDLFEQSSMSFGEHLEELRRALIKAFIWLGIGTAIGLYFSEDIVRAFQTPLEAAVRQFRAEKAVEAFEEANGSAPTEEMTDLIKGLGLVPEVRYVDPATLSNVAEELSAEEESSPTESAGDSEDSSTDESEAQTTDDEADATDPEASTTSAAVEDALAVVMARPNPWKGIDAESLSQLKPFIIWKPTNTNMVSLQATEGFMVYLKAALIAGVVIGSPGIFWHIWQFFAAGLYPHERRYVYWYLPLSLLLFLAGVSLAFFGIFRLVLGFLMMYTSSLGADFTPRLTDYMSFALFLPLGFGIAFQLPLVMLGLHRFGIVSADVFVSQWRVAVLVISFLSMLLTPAEPYSMVGLAVPLVGLYFFGIFLCRYMPKGAGIGSPDLDPKT